MNTFDLVTPRSIDDAIKAHARSNTAQQGANVRFIAGGTNLVDYMKIDVEKPAQLIDINSLDLATIKPTSDGGLQIGALARNADVAHDEAVKSRYPALSQALLSGASPQLRNMATTAGNLLQKTRCVYYRDTAARCNKRTPGSGCDALEGHHRMLAILGTSPQCIASNPSDQNVALMALEAIIHVRGVKGARAVPIADFYKLPGDTPHIETVLEPGDLITHVTLPPPQPGTKSVYLKLRDRASYEFALASAAVAMRSDASGRIEHVRVALGGVGTIPWRAPQAEQVLLGKQASDAIFRSAADAALQSAAPLKENAFKVELAKRCLTQALRQCLQNA